MSAKSLLLAAILLAQLLCVGVKANSGDIRVSLSEFIEQFSQDPRNLVVNRNFEYLRLIYLLQFYVEQYFLESGKGFTPTASQNVLISSIKDHLAMSREVVKLADLQALVSRVEDELPTSGNPLPGQSVPYASILRNDSASFFFEIGIDNDRVVSIFLGNSLCESVRNIFQCEVSDLVSNASIVRFLPVTVSFREAKSFKDLYLGKLLGGNETLVQQDFPILLLPEVSSSVKVASLKNVPSVEEKDFEFDFYHRNPHCQSGQVKRWKFALPPGWVIAGAPKVYSTVLSSNSSKAVAFIEGEKVVVEAGIYNRGSCLKVLGSAVSKDARGAVGGNVVVSAIRQRDNTVEQILLDESLGWNESHSESLDTSEGADVKVRVTDIFGDQHTSSLNSGESYASKFLSIRRTGDSVQMKAPPLKRIFEELSSK